jgi:hypothetical protein
MATTLSANNVLGIFSDSPFVRTSPNVAATITLNNTYNTMSIGPVTINSGVTVTVATGATWVVV